MYFLDIRSSTLHFVIYGLCAVFPTRLCTGLCSADNQSCATGSDNARTHRAKGPTFKDCLPTLLNWSNTFVPVKVTYVIFEMQLTKLVNSALTWSSCAALLQCDWRPHRYRITCQVISCYVKRIRLILFSRDSKYTPYQKSLISYDVIRILR